MGFTGRTVCVVSWSDDGSVSVIGSCCVKVIPHECGRCRFLIDTVGSCCGPKPGTGGRPGRPPAGRGSLTALSSPRAATRQLATYSSWSAASRVQPVSHSQGPFPILSRPTAGQRQQLSGCLKPESAEVAATRNTYWRLTRSAVRGGEPSARSSLTTMSL